MLGNGKFDEEELRCQLEKLTHKDKLTEIAISVARLEEHIKGINGSIKRHEEQIQSNTNFKNKLIGGTATVGFITTFLSVLAITKSLGVW